MNNLSNPFPFSKKESGAEVPERAVKNCVFINDKFECFTKISKFLKTNHITLSHFYDF
jgi:hypothetical protein